MYTSTDKLFNIEISNSPCGALQASDWSIMNIPVEKQDVDNLISAYNGMSTTRHLALVLCRYKDESLLESLSHLYRFSKETKLKFVQELCLTYKGTTRRNGSKLTTIAEPAFLLCKGDRIPDYNKTTWFNKDFANATNHWDLTKNVHDGYPEPISKAKWGLFAWEVGLLMTGLSLPRQTNCFVYIGSPNDISLISFVKLFKLKCYCYWTKEQDANDALVEYESFEFEK